MKKVFVGFLVTLMAATSFAQQKINEDSVISLVAADACTEFAKVDAASLNADNFQMKLGMLMMNSFSKHDDALTAIYGEGYMTNQETMTGFGQKVGLQLALECKTFQDLIMKNPEIVASAMGQSPTGKTKKKYIEPKEVVKPADVSSNTTISSVSGKVVSFTPGEISYYTIKDGAKTKKVYWFGKFEGDDELIANPKKIIGKVVTFETTENKIYSAVSKIYKKIAVINYYYEGAPVVEEVRIDTEGIKQ